MRFILILTLMLFSAEVAFAKTKRAKSLNQPARVVTSQKSSFNKSARHASKKHVAKSHKKAKSHKAKKHFAKSAKKKKSYKMSEAERKALAKRQVEHARKIAGRPAREKAPPEFKANHEVIIKDHGFEQTPPTEEETAVMTAAVTSEDLQLDSSNGTTPYIDGTAVYVERDTSSVDEPYLAADHEVDFED